MDKEAHKHPQGGGVLRHLVFGSEDGMISTLGFLTGITGAAFSSPAILLAGLAEIFAGSLSMAVGTYLSTKSEREFLQCSVRIEKHEILEHPKEGKEELREILIKEGFKGKKLDMMVEKISKNKRKWLNVMLAENIGQIPKKFEDEKKASAAMFLAFIIGSIFPMLPYTFLSPNPALILSVVFTIITMFIVGAARTYYTGKTWWRSGLEMAVLGMSVAIVAYVAGRLVAGI